MQNKKVIAAIVLSITAVFSLLYGAINSPKGRGKAALIPEAAQKNEVIWPVKNYSSVKRSSAKTTFSSWGRNPFLLEPAAVNVFEKLVLNGILWDEKEPMAIINDEVVKIGDKAGGSTIVGITQNKVILNDGIENSELILGKE